LPVKLFSKLCKYNQTWSTWSAAIFCR